MEKNLRLYLEGKISSEKFAEFLSSKNFNILSSDESESDSDYEFTPNHLEKILADSLNGKFSLENLKTIASGLLFSDCLTWDGGTELGKRISDIVFYLDNPDISYPLTLENVKLWKVYLETGGNRFEKK